MVALLSWPNLHQFRQLTLLLLLVAACGVNDVKSQALFEGGPTAFPLLNSYIPGFYGYASPKYAFSSYSMGGFKFQGQEDEVAMQNMMMQQQGGGGPGMGGGAPGAGGGYPDGAGAQMGGGAGGPPPGGRK